MMQRIIFNISVLVSFVSLLLLSCGEEKSKNVNSLVINGDLEFKKVKKGNYTLGETGEKLNGRIKWSGGRKVSIKKGYYISSTEITNQQFNSLLGKTTETHFPDHPKSIISPIEIEEFINEANKNLKGMKIRLPTEDEWEIAYRYPQKQNSFYWDQPITKINFNTNDYAWFYGNTKTIMPVAKKTPNYLGLFDMCGNVSEVCKANYTYVTKGGSCEPNHIIDPQIWFLPSMNMPIEKTFKTQHIGFRLILEIEE